jgi:trimethylamine--corrinoid protein Co-methyltransferase
MRREFYYPRLSDRRHYEEWLAGGEPDARAKANRIARELLRDHRPAALPAGVTRRIEREFGDICGPYGNRMKGGDDG